MKVPAELLEALDKAVMKIVTVNKIAIEELTERQVVSAIKQAILAGDFQRYIVESNNAQSVVYLPFSECERLRSEIAELKDQLARYKPPAQTAHALPADVGAGAT